MSNKNYATIKGINDSLDDVLKKLQQPFDETPVCESMIAVGLQIAQSYNNLPYQDAKQYMERWHLLDRVLRYRLDLDRARRLENWRRDVEKKKK